MVVKDTRISTFRVEVRKKPSGCAPPMPKHMVEYMIKRYGTTAPNQKSAHRPLVLSEN